MDSGVRRRWRAAENLLPQKRNLLLQELREKRAIAGPGVGHPAGMSAAVSPGIRTPVSRSPFGDGASKG